MKKLLLTLSAALTMAVADATIYRVDGTVTTSGDGSSWAAAFKTLQEGINAATVANDEVWVKAGTYQPALDANGSASPADARDKVFYIKSTDIKLYGGFAGNEAAATQRNPATNITILSGDINAGGIAANDCYHVLLTLARGSACVVDGFTITGGKADVSSNFTVVTPSASPYRNVGGGMYNFSSSSPTVRNCIFTGNAAVGGGGMLNSPGSNASVSNCMFSDNTGGSAGGGGGMYNNISSPTVSNCFFSNNSSGAQGGGMYNLNASPTVINCVFNGNSAPGSGGGIYNTGNNNLTLNSCTFYGNQTTLANISGAGLSYTSTVGTSTVVNCIFYNNTTPNNAGDVNREEIYKSGNMSTLNVSYCIIRDYSSSATNNYTAGSGIMTNDPLFASTTDLDGPDNIFGTADDGLRIGCSSPAKDAGTGTTPGFDITGSARIGFMDLGAYDASSFSTTAFNEIPTTSTAVLLEQTAATLSYSDCASEVLKLDASTGTLRGSTMAKVYVQSSAQTYNNDPYVRRSYDITPATNPNTATATVTLYFLQSDFTDYNAVRGSRPSLPVDITDTAGYKGNLRITQQHGTSVTGEPGTYSGSGSSSPDNILITPTSVTYNATASRWEVTFPVTGFSGFFAHSSNDTFPLPVKLVDFGARKASANSNELIWNTAMEESGSTFTITRSSDGLAFEPIGTIVGKGNASDYTFTDNHPLNAMNYYRLQITEHDGKIAHSTIAIVRNGLKGSVTIAPIPAKELVTITNTNSSLAGTTAVIMDMRGREKIRFTLVGGNNIDIATWPSGIYSLRLVDGTSVKLVKQ